MAEKKKAKYIIVALIIIAAGSWVVFFGEFKQADVQESDVNSQTSEKSVQLAIDYGDGNSNTFNAEFTEGMAAFNLLESEAGKSAITLKTKKYDIGIFIEAIGDRENGQDGKYWLYYVNGSLPMVAADKLIIKPGDKVEFKFEKSPF